MCGDEVLCKSILSRCFICTFIIWDSTSYRYRWRWPLSSFIHEKQGGLMGLFHLENTPQNHECFIISSSIFLMKYRLKYRFLHIYLSIHDDCLTWKLKNIIKIRSIHTSKNNFYMRSLGNFLVLLMPNETLLPTD